MMKEFQQTEDGRNQGRTEQGLRMPTGEQRRIVEQAATEFFESDFEPAYDQLDPIARQVLEFMSPSDAEDTIGPWVTVEDIADAVRIQAATVKSCLTDIHEAGFVLSTWAGPALDEELRRVEV